MSDKTAVILGPAQVGGRIGYSVKTLANWRALGTGPKSFHLGRLVRYFETDLNDWIAESAAVKRAN